MVPTVTVTDPWKFGFAAPRASVPVPSLVSAVVLLPWIAPLIVVFPEPPTFRILPLAIPTAPPTVSVFASDWILELPETVTEPVRVLFPERFSIAPLAVGAPLVERLKLLASVEPPCTSKLPAPDTFTVEVPVALVAPATMTPLLRLTVPVKPALAPVRTSSPVFVLARVPLPVMDPPNVPAPVPPSVSVPVPSATVPPGVPLRFEMVSVWLPRLNAPLLTARFEVDANWFEALSLTVPPPIVRPPSIAVVLRLRMPELTVVIPV